MNQDCLELSVLTLFYIGGLAAQRISTRRLTSRPSSLTSAPTLATAASEEHGDHVPAETGFIGPVAAATGHHGSKYFQDIYVAMEKPKELTFGHVKETPHDWEQRFEKLNLQNLNRQGKVRWGDKHGGYGEHYWDYNHAGHGGDGDGEESQQNEEYAHYNDESKDSPIISTIDGTLRGKREPSVSEDVEFINDKAKTRILSGRAQKHGGNYRKVNDFRGKREQKKYFGEALIFDPKEGVVIDQNTGTRYKLNPLI